MKRSGFKRAEYVPPPPAPLRPLENAPNYAGGTTGAAIEKGEPTKPGKYTPNAAERAWMDWIVAFGCVACWKDGKSRPAAVHHILKGGRRMGHLFTLPLCDPGHHQNGQPLGLVSRHPYKARFEVHYGTELDLLEMLRERRNKA